MYTMANLIDDWIILSGPTINPPSTVSQGFYVSCMVRAMWETWSQPRGMYLHADGLWYQSTHSDAGPTGYFATREDAASALRLSEDPERDERIVAQVCAGIVAAEVVTVRAEKRRFQT